MRPTAVHPHTVKQGQHTGKIRHPERSQAGSNATAVLKWQATSFLIVAQDWARHGLYKPIPVNQSEITGT